MAIAFRERAFTRNEAAEVVGICRTRLDVWVHRFPFCDFSARRAGRRWYSVRDITALRVALQLKGAMPLAEAIPTAVAHLAHPPNPEVFLVSTRGKTFVTGADTAAMYAVERGAAIVAVGRIAAEVEAACAVLYEREAGTIHKDRPCRNPIAH
jgi:hypothetical protein